MDNGGLFILGYFVYVYTRHKMEEYPTEKYGKIHREIKKDRIKQYGNQCELTGKKPDKDHQIHSHHLQKISLAFLMQSHIKENMRNIIDTVHNDFHQNTESDIEDGKLMYKRQKYAKRVYQDPTNTEHRKKLDEADSKLIPEYVDKMMDLPEEYGELYQRQALIGAYETNKALMIKARESELEIARLKEEIEVLKNRTKAKIIQIVDYFNVKQE